jgi:hypothetical protein
MTARMCRGNRRGNGDRFTPNFLNGIKCLGRHFVSHQRNTSPAAPHRQVRGRCHWGSMRSECSGLSLVSASRNDGILLGFSPSAPVGAGSGPRPAQPGGAVPEAGLVDGGEERQRESYPGGAARHARPRAGQRQRADGLRGPPDPLARRGSGATGGDGPWRRPPRTRAWRRRPCGATSRSSPGHWQCAGKGCGCDEGVRSQPEVCGHALEAPRSAIDGHLAGCSVRGSCVGP